MCSLSSPNLLDFQATFGHFHCKVPENKPNVHVLGNTYGQHYHSKIWVDTCPAARMPIVLMGHKVSYQDEDRHSNVA